MLPRYNYQLTGEGLPEIRKYTGGKDVSDRGAFPAGKKLKIEVRIPRIFGDAGVVLRIHRDGEGVSDIPLTFESTERGKDTYFVELTPEKGLYYWELLFLRGGDTLFTDSINNKDFTLSSHSQRLFRMLAYEDRSGAPDWFTGGTMYQIFTDRFAKGKKKMPLREGAVLEDDWYESVPEFAAFPGGHIENNRFFGGNIYGIIEKLDYLESLGVNILYLNPIFEAYSNHKYDTGNYERVDEMFGGDKAFKKLLAEAEKRGMKVILDGVFNHTGSDSKYFNKYGNYDTVGAYASEESPYHDWYHFGETRDKYESWWGIKTLPRLDHECESCRRYFTNKNGIGTRYAKMGTGGWRLDVVDELSDDFLDEFRDSVKTANKDAVIIGEVWENAADKIAYDKRRRYFQDGQLDSVMNYPLRTAIIEFCANGNARALYDTLTEIYASYPPRVCNSLMNLLGTHDTERILTCLGIEGDEINRLTNTEKSQYRLSKSNYEKAVKRLKMASIIQYTAYGVPSLYYADEAGAEGFRDPFNRIPYPWGRENEELLEHYRALGKMRASEKMLKDGSFKAELISGSAIKLTRDSKKEKIIVLSSREVYAINHILDGKYKDLLTGEIFDREITVLPDTATVLKKIK